MAEHTPMIKQYLTIKAEYKDAFLFFRLGDFYELFFEDAKLASQELEITLTSRGTGTDTERIPMCGVPYHAAEQYIQTLIEKGYKVAICEQVEDPRQAKGVVKREVVKLITPGTVMEGKTIQEKENNFIASVTDFLDETYGFALTDLTTGENFVTIIQGSWQDVINEIATTRAKEIIFSPDHSEENIKALLQQLAVTASLEPNEELPETFHSLVDKLEQKKLIATFGRLCSYLVRTQKRSLDHLQPVVDYSPTDFMRIDLHSKRNLELVETIREKKKKGSLLWLLDKTVTAMGGRLLKQWLERPLLNKKQIDQRLSMVETFIEQYFQREELRELLKEVYDLERLAGKVAYGNVNARELVQLKRSLQQIPIIISTVKELNNCYGGEIIKDIDTCDELLIMLSKSLKEDPPLSIKDGGIIQDGYNEQLDQYRDASRNGKSWIARLEQQEKQITGIKSLKVGYNKVFGYYIEVTKANLVHLPEGRYERKQTLSNAERFITPELKEKEALILEAEERIEQLEYDLFLQLRENVKQYISKLQYVAKKISEIDVLQSFAKVSEENRYAKPQFNDERHISILEGRHPVVEKVLNSGEYVSNDVIMNEEREILLITGPNMAGKSTYMRQLALISILAQIGCYVPADSVNLPIFDQVFTRIGAADDLASGQSTFMVEMLETKNAISKATKNSLILLDEIGRGTSTYDGMALAQAIIEYIHDEIGSKTLFSTHYHELTALEHDLSAVKNVHVSAVEEEGKVVFLHKVIDGQADKSYGIYVAQLAELPDKLIIRAKTILATLENQPSYQKVSENLIIESDKPVQLSLFNEGEGKTKKQVKPSSDEEKKVISSIKKLDLLNITPLEAIQKLNDLQKKLKV
ncbi:DNA mismatch repair protein MutS [Anaerobacillus alkalidiazotrophicus]|uniref:DNA mismatch repair protein MutS n=1 Tax=Anaerobacillus alkalidiazotrophicus TaxID=472963 RepID=A0A1S2LZN3_9BACI|nr:DNA mismatch repair protein MutS [Anaerobacillus alkalidiazotrophicus]OIJ17912.1 DNA mismatch repair protein MutS [Anaerobacillus alkalidiazotrophicus]